MVHCADLLVLWTQILIVHNLSCFVVDCMLNVSSLQCVNQYVENINLTLEAKVLMACHKPYFKSSE